MIRSTLQAQVAGRRGTGIMRDESPEAEARRRRLRELLLGHLQSAGGPPWPGADALTLQQVLLSYPRAAVAGRVPTREQLLAAHPDLAAELAAFFAARDADQGAARSA